MEKPQKGRLRDAMNSYRRRIEVDMLASRARLEAAERLAKTLEAVEPDLPRDVQAALRAYRKASRAPV